VLILPQMLARDMAGAIRELSRAFHAADARWDAEKLNQAALQREEQMSTAMDFGAAFPHVRSSACLRLQFAMGRTPEPFAWGGAGSLKVRFVFLNAVPASEAMGYLKLISALARLGKEPTLLEEFKTAATARELLELLGKISVRK
jgi:mannitol/fructose-specific phosphotransferase system IIA component (Ntr-type)